MSASTNVICFLCAEVKIAKFSANLQGFKQNLGGSEYCWEILLENGKWRHHFQIPGGGVVQGHPFVPPAGAHKAEGVDSTPADVILVFVIRKSMNEENLSFLTSLLKASDIIVWLASTQV